MGITRGTEWTPYFLVDKQINTMEYLESDADIEYLRSIPGDWLVRHPDLNRFINRLRAEREYFLDRAGEPDAYPLVTLVTLAEYLDDSARNDTQRAWQLQSYPNVTLNRNWDSPLSQDGYYLFARPGDLPHPSTAASVVRQLDSSRADIITWNSIHYANDGNGSRQPVEFIRRPGLELFSLLQSNFSGFAFAVRGERLEAFRRDYPMYDFSDEGHFLQTSLAVIEGVKWRHVPEYLSIGNEKKSLSTKKCCFPALKNYEDVLAPIASKHDLKVLPSSGTNTRLPYELQPQTQPSAITAIIPFRDKAAMTLECIKSLLTQQLDVPLEIMLVNNQSRDEELELLQKGIRSMGAVAQIRLIHYNRPFNHSAQSNLGASEAKGEVLVFLNNDAVLKTVTALSEMSRWAMVPGVGTVGGRIERKNGKLVCSGIRVKTAIGADYKPTVEESTDERFSKVRRETFGNTFACAVIRRDRFLEIGGLDNHGLPAGYNDVDFNARARKHGYRHIYLGDAEIIHDPATSRRQSDEHREILLLKQRHPEFLEWGQYQLEGESRKTKKSASMKHSITRLIAKYANPRMIGKR